MDYPWAERHRRGGEGERHRALRPRAALRVPRPSRREEGEDGAGALDRSAGLAAACGAEVVVIHPGFWLGRDREQTLDDVVRWLGSCASDSSRRAARVPFGIEVMGRVSELGSIEDMLEIAERVAGCGR